MPAPTFILEFPVYIYLVCIMYLHVCAAMSICKDTSIAPSTLPSPPPPTLAKKKQVSWHVHPYIPIIATSLQQSLSSSP